MLISILFNAISLVQHSDPLDHPSLQVPHAHLRSFLVTNTSLISREKPSCFEIVHKELSIWKNLHLIFTIFLNLFFIPVPVASPGNFSGHEISQTAIQLFWTPVPQDKANGIVIGYNVSLKEIEGNQSTRHIHFVSSRLQAVIGWLKPFTAYKLNVKAFTIKGSGPPSHFITVKTEEEGE